MVRQSLCFGGSSVLVYGPRRSGEKDRRGSVCTPSGTILSRSTKTNFSRVERKQDVSRYLLITIMFGGWTRTDRHVAVENVRKPPASGQRTMKLFWQVQ